MTLTEEIASIAQCSIEQAKIIRDYIDEEIGLDWSECSKRTMTSAIKEAFLAVA